MLVTTIGVFIVTMRYWEDGAYRLMRVPVAADTKNDAIKTVSASWPCMRPYYVRRAEWSDYNEQGEFIA